ncbi:transcriptional activator protein ExaE [mine drainage metagenome]|uniref:Transcriptional activator protein ExaE n=1 Tax=mine drainage metagenome TaxID=410659 RepID=A0A1J5T011_9ZZZZ
MNESPSTRAAASGLCWIIEDQSMLRQLLSAVVQDAGGFAFVRELSDGDAALARLAVETPDFVLLDLVLPGTPGLDVIDHLRRTAPSARILIFSDRLEASLIREVLARGANGFIAKVEHIPVLRSAIQQVRAGNTFLCPRSSSLLRTHVFGESGLRVESLTRQERAVLKLYAEGRSAKEIASLLTITPGTASNHLTRIKQKLGAHEPVALIRYAADAGLIPPLR